MWDHNINIYPSELLSTKTKEFRINKSCKKKVKKKKVCSTIIKKNIWTIYILYLIISLQIFFKALIKYKNDYQWYLNYIYIWIILCILLYIFKCIHVYVWDYKLVTINNKLSYNDFKIWKLVLKIVKTSYIYACA